MRRADAAEWILSLATSPDRAHSIAGDLAEQAPLRGAGWIWGALVRTLGSLIWRDFADAPFRMTGIAVLGTFIQVFYMLVIMVGIILAHLALSLALGLDSLEDRPDTLAWQLESLAAFSASSFLLGRWLARRAPNREIAAYAIVWVIVHVVWIPVVFLTTSGTQFIPGPLDLLIDAVATVIGPLCIAAGVKRMRSRLVLR